MTKDQALHILGAALIQAVCIAADLAAPGVVLWGLVFNLAFWPAREWLQHRGKKRPWSVDKWFEAIYPAAVASLMVIVYVWVF